MRDACPSFLALILNSTEAKLAPIIPTTQSFVMSNKDTVIVLIMGGVLVLPLFYAVHCGLDYCCVRHAKRFCRRKGFDVCRFRWKPAFNNRGIKTEFTLVELDCFDVQKERRLVRLLVWPFGVRRVLIDDMYPDNYDIEWPQSTKQQITTKSG